MADRVTKVTLLLQAQQYLSGMRESALATQNLGTQAARLAGHREAFNLLGRAMLTAGTLMAAGVGIAVARFVDFDQAMSQVKAVTQETAENMALLGEAALDAGGATVYTATEAANAIEELGKNGQTTAEILGGGLAASLNLAAAGALDVARAAEVAAITQKQFNLAAAEMPHVADLLAAGAGKAAGDVEDLAQALSQSGLVAAQTGLSIEETTGTLAAFADNALLGSDAGTSLRTLLLRLTPTSGEAQRAMDDLKLSAYDAGGEFIGMAAFAGQLQEKLGHLTDEERQLALTTIFGQDAIRGATLLYEQGAAGIQKYIDQTNDAGYAARVAADRLDNLAGDVEKLGGAFDTALIQSGSASNDVLRSLVQSATEGVDAFNRLPGPVQATALAVGGVAAAATLAGGAFFLAVPKVAEYRRALDTLGPTGQRVAGVLGTVGKAAGLLAGLTVAINLFGRLASAGEEAARGVEETLRVLREAGTADALFAGTSDDVDDLASALDLLLGESVNSNMERFGSTLNDVLGGSLPDQVRNTREQFATLGQTLSQLVGAGDGERAAEMFAAIAATAAEQGYSTEELLTLMPAYRESLAGVANAQGGAATSADANAEALAALGGSAYDAEGQIADLADIIRAFGHGALSTRDAEREFQAAVDDLTASVSANGSTLDRNTEQGRSNESALDDIARSAHELAAARLEETGSHEAAAEAIQMGREQLILALAQFGITGQAAQDYADDLGLIPADITTGVTLTGLLTAQEELDRFFSTNDGRNLTFAAKLRNLPNADGGMHSYANGGMEGMYTGGTPLYKFAEPETGWEAFISGRPGMEKENIGYAFEALRRLGAFSGSGGGSGGGGVAQAPSRTVEINAHGVDPGTVAELVYRKMQTIVPR